MIVNFLAKRNLALVPFLAGMAAAVPVGIVGGHVVDGSLDGLVKLAAIAATLAAVFALIVAGAILMSRVQHVQWQAFESRLSAKYGRALRRVTGDVWSVDGELRQASLTGDTFLVGGRELERVAA